MPASPGSQFDRVPLASLFCPACIEQIPTDATKPRVLEQLVNSLANAQLLSATEIPKILNGLMSRERIGSTALGKGLAIPHLRIDSVDEFIGAIGLSSEGIDFKSLDGASTKLVLLVLGPSEERERHFELMGRLSALLRDKTTLWFLNEPHTADEVFEYLTDLDLRSGESARSPNRLPVGTVATPPTSVLPAIGPNAR